MRRPRSVLALAVTALVLGSASPVAAAPATDFEAPFPCGEVWKGTTRSSHSPSPNSVDFNRTDDLGDPVVASAPGRIMTSVKTDNGSYGIWVQMDHGNNERTLYAHLQANYVTPGQRVDQGQMLGRVGSSGNSTGPHMHYEQRKGTTVTTPYFHDTRYSFGTNLTSRNCAHFPVAGDWDGDGTDQVTAFERTRIANWRIRRPDGSLQLARIGWATDQPVPGDWDGDGRTNLGVRGPDTRVFHMVIPDVGIRRIAFGAVGDLPVAGNWGGDAKFEVGVWNPATATFSLRAENGTVSKVKLGNVDDWPVTGDWDGDGITDLGVFDQPTATWTLRRVDAQGLVWLSTLRLGRAGDLPMVGDWDGDGNTDFAVWTPATATVTQRIGTGPNTAPRMATLKWGAAR